MTAYASEETTWERLKDSQREAENRRLAGPGLRSGTAVLLAAAVLKVGRLVRHVAGRLADRQPAELLDESEAASDAA